MRYPKPIHNAKLNQGGEFVAKKRVVTVWTVFRDNGEWSIYHCPDCKHPIAQYKGDLVAEVPGGTPSKYPVMIQCRNYNCGRKVMFKDATEQTSYE